MMNFCIAPDATIPVHGLQDRGLADGEAGECWSDKKTNEVAVDSGRAIYQVERTTELEALVQAPVQAISCLGLWRLHPEHLSNGSCGHGHSD